MTTAIDLITDSFNIAQIVSEGDALTAEQSQYGKRALNAMVSGWSTNSPIWCRVEGALPMVVAQQSYSMGPGGDFAARPLKILDARLDVAGIETPMTQLVRDEYFDLPNKAVGSRPTQWYYDPQIGSGRLYVWPTLGQGVTGTMRFTYQRPLTETPNLPDEADFPAEWTECLTYNLAVRLCMRGGAPIPPGVAETAAETLNRMLGWDRDFAVIVSPMSEW